MKTTLKTLSFPKGFLFGAATSPYQISGCDNTQWDEWERSRKRYHDLIRQGELTKHRLENFVCGKACNHDILWHADFILAKTLGLKALRFGAEPARVYPVEGIFHKFWFADYRERVRFAQSLGIVPVVNIWHWTIPIWWADKGGMANQNTPEYFAAYVEHLVESLGDEVEYWTVLNETNVFINHSYKEGLWPPQVKNKETASIVFENLIECHKRAYEIIKRKNPNAKVGIAENLTWNEMRDDTLEERTEKERKDREWNWSFLDRIKGQMDFVGMNHYGRDRSGGNENKVVSDMGWELYPEAIYHILKETHDRYKKPILITENGLADAADTRRGWFIYETLKYVHKAIKDGVPVLGYLHWSLMDNFEWAYGFSPRFGLMEIDRENGLKRNIRPSAYFYAEICKANGITEEIVSSHKEAITLHDEK